MTMVFFPIITKKMDKESVVKVEWFQDGNLWKEDLYPINLYNVKRDNMAATPKPLRKEIQMKKEDKKGVKEVVKKFGK